MLHSIEMKRSPEKESIDFLSIGWTSRLCFVSENVKERKKKIM